jgi:2-hydroxymuconate-semialdehyde hydrolase
MITDSNPRQFVEVDGHRIAYTRAGQGPSVVLIHGIPTSSVLWRHAAPILARDGFEVLTFDLLGYGASDKPHTADLGIAAQSRLLACALKGLSVPAGTLVGHDIGGGIVQLMCVDGLVSPKRIVLVDSIVYDSFPEPGIARLKDPAWDAILGAPDFDLGKGLAKGFARGMFHKDRVGTDMIEAYVRPFLGAEGRLAYLRAARALRTGELSTRMDAVERLDIPALIVWGAEDVFQPLDYGARLANAMPRAHFEVIEQAGHFLPEDEPERLARTIGNFIRSDGGI